MKRVDTGYYLQTPRALGQMGASLLLGREIRIVQGLCQAAYRGRAYSGAFGERVNAGYLITATPQADIAFECGVSLRTMQRYIGSVQDLGWVERVYDGRLKKTSWVVGKRAHKSEVFRWEAWVVQASHWFRHHGFGEYHGNKRWTFDPQGMVPFLDHWATSGSEHRKECLDETISKYLEPDAPVILGPAKCAGSTSHSAKLAD